MSTAHLLSAAGKTRINSFKAVQKPEDLCFAAASASLLHVQYVEGRGEGEGGGGGGEEFLDYYIGSKCSLANLQLHSANAACVPCHPRGTLYLMTPRHRCTCQPPILQGQTTSSASMVLSCSATRSLQFARTEQPKGPVLGDHHRGEQASPAIAAMAGGRPS